MRGLSGAFLVAALAAGRAAAEEAEGEGEEPDPTTKRKRQAHTIIVIGSGLVGISLAFEKARETLEEATSENMKPILNSIFAELTLLGLPEPRWHHHPLLLDASGTKLAKRRNSPSLADRRERGEDGRLLAAQLRLQRLPAGISLGSP